MDRYLLPYVEKDLVRKMVFVGGPRQCGKTTMAKAVLNRTEGAYFNWDLDENRRTILSKGWSDDHRLLVFDELHKFHRWKNWIKGIYDTSRDKHRFLVTGSARLDVYRRGGDSLMGRYHYWRLHPLSLDERPAKLSDREALQRLMTVGGFPEPFLDGDETEARRWRRERMDRVLKDDVRDLESIREIQTLGLFLDALRSRVGSPVVLANIADDLQVSPVTLKRWLEVLERMYVVFVVRPFTKKLPRAVQKPPKVYFFDTGDVIGDEGARFENLVATHLLKRIHFLEDRTGFRLELRYVRDKEKHEADFALLKEGILEDLIEAKWADAKPASGLLYFANRLNPPRATQIVGKLKEPFKKGRFRLVPAVEYFRPGYFGEVVGDTGLEPATSTV